METNRLSNIITKISASGSIVIFIIIAFEFMIMISPFAFFFYSVFNPVFSFFDQYSTTKWLTDFFLPHMIFPPTLFLQIIRILGSILFLLGALIFIVCAIQVYAAKIFKWGIAEKGLYKYIRHPQYLGLGVWGIGMSILWPRFMTLATLSLMFILYYFLSRNEERRMLYQFGEGYNLYIKRTGMFIPRRLEKLFYPISKISEKRYSRFILVPLFIIIFVLGSGFILRDITLNSINFESKNNLTLVTILPEDINSSHKILEDILKNNSNMKFGFLSDSKNYLGYLMPPDYIMQGMIANTDSEFHLYKQHNTVRMITDWILHPFQHLRTPPSYHMAEMHNVDQVIARRHHCPLNISDDNLKCDDCPYRRVIILEVSNSSGDRLSGSEILSINTNRKPVYCLDLNLKTGELVKATKVDRSTAWDDVPTPAF